MSTHNKWFCGKLLRLIFVSDYASYRYLAKYQMAVKWFTIVLLIMEKAEIFYHSNHITNLQNHQNS